MQQQYEKHHNKILLIDNEINICKDFLHDSELEGYISDFALTGESGLKKAEQNDFDLLITDFEMPDISGVKIINKMKNENPEISIIIINDYESGHTGMEAIKLGAMGYLTKPVNAKKIMNEVHHVEEKEALGKELDKFQDWMITKKLVRAVLDRTAVDEKFWKDLMENGTKALDGYDLNIEAKAAIASGDINWIEKNIGKLSKRQKEFLIARLLVERW